MISFHSSLAPWEVRVLSCQVLFDLVRADRGTNKTYISYPLAFRSMRSSTKSELAYLMSKSWNRHGAKIWNVYGLSQTMVHWFIDQPAINIYLCFQGTDLDMSFHWPCKAFSFSLREEITRLDFIQSSPACGHSSKSWSQSFGSRPIVWGHIWCDNKYVVG